MIVFNLSLGVVRWLKTYSGNHGLQNPAPPKVLLSNHLRDRKLNS